MGSILIASIFEYSIQYSNAASNWPVLVGFIRFVRNLPVLIGLHPSSVQRQTSEIDKELITELLQMIDTHNVIAQSFRRVREFYQYHPYEIFSLKLYSQRNVDRRMYSAPSCDEVAALIVGDFDSSDHGRDIIVRSTGGRLQRIYETHALY
ncbi:hypothetical protein Ahy_B03g062991 [Arachis hypogaea]|uniref:Uncharacterized protein n=1 Tax=Arachis hypogaea TaxID=3818 RepID=A0A444ZVX4_ARAHY|nr:hypothetical protein Ahy_B03g062991 [Arachis hypogaea]